MAVQRLCSFRGDASNPKCAVLAKTLRKKGHTLREIAKMLHIAVRSVERCLKPDAAKAEREARKAPAYSEAKSRWLKVLRHFVDAKDSNGIKMYPSLSQLSAKLISGGWGPSSVQTVRRGLHILGFKAKKKPRGPKLRVGDAEKRVDFCTKELQREGTLLFSDEKIFDTNFHGTRFDWVPKDDPADPLQIDRWAPRVHVWGCIGVGVKMLVCLPAGLMLDSKRYQTLCLKPHLKTLKEGVFQQDGARCHTSKSTKEWLVSKKVKFLDPWPARSPDLNVIELLWARMANNVSKRGATSSEELAKMVKEEWAKIPQGDIDHLVDEEYRKRVRACIAVGGRTLTRKDVRDQAF